jgi:NAD(P)-dependent dehydrogenase (short-subunit alcohol dehydrogenase family)
MTNVLVTGGASGIGLAIARRFIEGGCRVLVCDRDDAALERARAQLPGLRVAHCDVAEVTQIEALFATVGAELGGLDVLVNNVGIGGPTMPAEQLDPADWRQVIDINLTGTFEVTRRAIALLKASEGTIIVMSSAAGRYGYPNRLPYAVSKWGLIGFAKTLAMELGPHNVTVNAILPGAVGGDRFMAVIEGRAQLSGKSIAATIADGLASQSVKRVAAPEHVAELAWFLTTPAGRSISGAALPMDNDLQHG